MGVSADRGGNDDFQTVLEGGETFVARLEQLAKATQDMKAAERDLNLGKAAKAALDECSDKLAQANTRLAEAKKSADTILASAKEQAEQKKAAAESDRQEARAYAEKVRAEAKAETEQMRSAAKAAQDEAARLLANARRQADEMLSHAKAQSAAADDMTRQAEIKLADARKAEAQANALITRVRAAVGAAQ